MAKEFYTVEVIPHLENGTCEYNYVPTFEVRIDKGGNEKSLTARLICPEWQPINIIETIDVISGVLRCPYVSDFIDISYIVNLCRLDKLDAHRILKQLDDAGSVVFEVTVIYLLEQSV